MPLIVPLNPLLELHTARPDLAGPRWHLPSSRPRFVLAHAPHSGATCLFDHGKEIRRWADPLTALAWMARFELDETSNSRWIGYLSYDLGRLFEPMQALAADNLELPLFVFGLINDSASHPPHAAASSPPHPPLAASQAVSQAAAALSPNAYLSAVSRAIDYIRAGDIFQVNLARRLSIPTPLSPNQIWRRLISHFPAAYGAFLDFGSFALLSNSPELFLQVDPRRPHQPMSSRRILTRPIKGTRPRGPGMAAELRESEKDAAELNMIVDLERNDLGRICQIGSVRVTQPRTIESHPTVHHGVASIEGILRPNVDFVEILRATFPGGSITGAPKIRAMQIIEELEPLRRGPYCGAIGYLASSGAIQFNVAIRTMILKDSVAHISTGGGIVADSSPEAEYDETVVKARALLAALRCT